MIYFFSNYLGFLIAAFESLSQRQTFTEVLEVNVADGKT